MRQRFIHETAIKDVADLIGAILSKDKKYLDNFKSKNKRYSSSISSSTKDLVMTFPVLCSNTINVKTAMMISKAHERKCVAMLQMLFSSIWVSDAQDAKEFINTFHSNISMADVDTGLGQISSIDDFVSATDAAMNDFKNLRRESFMSDYEILSILKEDNAKAMHEYAFPIESIRDISIQDFKVFPGNDIRLNEAKVSNKAPGYGERSKRTKFDKNKNKYVDGYDYVWNPDSINPNSENKFFTKQLMDTDVKKSNEMVPSLIIIRFSGKGYNDDKQSVYEAIVGVKSRLIPVDSFDIIDHIFAKSTDNNYLLKLIRATTREISFVKDFLLGLQKAKVDALSNSGKGSGSRIWKTLEIRSTRSRLKKALHQQNNANAITSLVMTADEVDYLKKNSNIAMDNVMVARKMMESYNLLSIVIVDEAMECASFLYDGDDTFETLAFTGMERDAGDGGMYKKVINMMSKMV